ncbi:MAG: hypothetical protein F6K48_30645 [Okeania sp. SIO3H1]|nr:hypothetical protein [Okeania sp. SIO3H1]
MIRALFAIVFIGVTLTAGWAGEADVIAVKARVIGDRLQVSVTVQHADTGWDHYADRWDILAPDGQVLGERVLFHPHVNEQPFTRQHTIPWSGDFDEITIRAHDSVHGLGGAEMTVPITR